MSQCIRVLLSILISLVFSSADALPQPTAVARTLHPPAIPRVDAPKGVMASAATARHTRAPPCGLVRVPAA